VTEAVYVFMHNNEQKYQWNLVLALWELALAKSLRSRLIKKRFGLCVISIVAVSPWHFWTTGRAFDLKKNLPHVSWTCCFEGTVTTWSFQENNAQ